jgi:hypothetical protein
MPTSPKASLAHCTSALCLSMRLGRVNKRNKWIFIFHIMNVLGKLLTPVSYLFKKLVIYCHSLLQLNKSFAGAGIRKIYI